MELELRKFELELKFPTKQLNPQINLPFLTHTCGVTKILEQSGLYTVGSVHNTVIPPVSIYKIYVEILLFRNMPPLNV